MIALKRVNIPYYKFTIQMILSEGGDSEMVTDWLYKNKVKDRSVLKEVNSAINDGSYNGAVTLFNSPLNRVIIVIYKHTSFKELFATLSHELYHATADIATSVDLKGDEALAYLQGYMGGILVNQLLKYYEASFNKAL